MPLALEETQGPETRYTVFIRVPIPRGDFVDPPTVGSLQPLRTCILNIWVGSLGFYERPVFMEGLVLGF